MNLQRALKRDGLFFIITYIYWILAHKDVNTVFTRARARASRKIRGTGSRGRVVVPLRKMIIFGGDIETTTFFGLFSLLIAATLPCNTVLCASIHIYIVSIKVFFFFFSSAATLAPDVNQYRRVNTFRDPVFLQSRE